MAFSLLRIGVRVINRNTANLQDIIRITATNNIATSAQQCSFQANSSLPCASGSTLLESKIFDAALSNPRSFAISKRNHSKHTETDTKRRQEDSDSDSDSDTDTDCKGRERSDFWRRKMRTFHGILDVNKDGVIAFDDFQLLAKRFQDLGHLDDGQAEEFRSVIRVTWEEQWGEISPYNLVTVEQYLTDMSHVLTDKDLRKRAHNFLPFLFKAVDKDQSGFISVNEFKLFFKCLGLSEETAAVSFAIIDKNGDGKLSLKEFVKLGKDFFFTEDETRVSKMFWGPLQDH